MLSALSPFGESLSLRSCGVSSAGMESPKGRPVELSHAKACAPAAQGAASCLEPVATTK